VFAVVNNNNNSNNTADCNTHGSAAFDFADLIVYCISLIQSEVYVCAMETLSVTQLDVEMSANDLVGGWPQITSLSSLSA